MSAGNPSPEGDDESRIREEAHRLWEGEGRPEGRDAAHWAAAREIIALQDSMHTTLRPVEETTGETVEPIEAVRSQGDVPGLTDLGEDPAGPSWENAAELSDVKPLETDDAAAAPRRSRRS